MPALAISQTTVCAFLGLCFTLVCRLAPLRGVFVVHIYTRVYVTMNWLMKHEHSGGGMPLEFLSRLVARRRVRKSLGRWPVGTMLMTSGRSQEFRNVLRNRRRSLFWTVERCSPVRGYKMNVLMMPSILAIISFFAVQLIAIHDCRAQESDGLVMHRIRSDRTLQYYHTQIGPSGRELISRLDKLSSETGQIPSRTDTINILSDSNLELSQVEWLWFETIIRKIQQPTISTQIIYQMYQIYSQSVPPLNCVYHVVTRLGESGGKSTITRGDYQFSYDTDNITFLSQSNGLSDKNSIRETWIYNGIEIREIEEAIKGISNEFVYSPNNLRSLYPEYHPMSNARISPLDSATNPDVRQESGFTVFSDPETIIFETTETIAGRQCVVAGFLDWAIFLDPLVGYSVVEERFGDIKFNGKYVHRDVYYRKQNSDFVQLAEGGFLPRRSLIEQSRGTTMFKNVETVVDSLELKPESSFAMTFKRPQHLYVSNNITGEGALASQGKRADVLQRRPTSQGVSILWLIIAGNGIVITLIFCIFMLRRRFR